MFRARLKTVGVCEYKFEMEAGFESGTEWRIVDVGGSRSQVSVSLPRRYNVLIADCAISHRDVSIRLSPSDPFVCDLLLNCIPNLLALRRAELSGRGHIARWVPYFDDGACPAA